MNEGGSSIWQGVVSHRRFAPQAHSFFYRLFMLAIDLDELASLGQGNWFTIERRGWLAFYRQDYLAGSEGPLKQAVWNKIAALGGAVDDSGKVVLLGNVRCLGFYFSPVNFYFCYQPKAHYLLAEVANTPWQERHYYLLDLQNLSPHDKTFHVSPFMSLAMRYHWQVLRRTDNLLIHIESYSKKGQGKLFDATLRLSSLPFNRTNIQRTALRWPWMTGKILLAIYWQALRLLLKRMPIFDHPHKGAR